VEASHSMMVGKPFAQIAGAFRGTASDFRNQLRGGWNTVRSESGRQLRPMAEGHAGLQFSHLDLAGSLLNRGS
jgi:hypothetical protein